METGMTRPPRSPLARRLSVGVLLLLAFTLFGIAGEDARTRGIGLRTTPAPQATGPALSDSAIAAPRFSAGPSATIEPFEIMSRAPADLPVERYPTH